MVVAHLESLVYADECRLNVERTTCLDEFGEACEGFKLSWHRVQERCREDVHPYKTRLALSLMSFLGSGRIP